MPSTTASASRVSRTWSSADRRRPGARRHLQPRVAHFGTRTRRGHGAQYRKVRRCARHPFSARFSGPRSPPIAAGESGHFCDGIRPHRYRARRPDRSARLQDVPHERRYPIGGPDRVLDIRLRPAPHYTGRVLGPDGRPVQGVRVALSSRLEQLDGDIFNEAPSTSRKKTKTTTTTTQTNVGRLAATAPLRSLRNWNRMCWSSSRAKASPKSIGGRTSFRARFASSAGRRSLGGSCSRESQSPIATSFSAPFVRWAGMSLTISRN